MEKCLVPEDQSSCCDLRSILCNLQLLGFCSDLDPISSRFEQILSVFLNELHCKRQIRPFPAMLGDGRPIDLYKLYFVVSKRGGFNSEKSWSEVADEVGLDSALGCPLKLIYAKYLNMLERCLQRVSAIRSDVGGFSWCDSEGEIRCLFKEILKQKKRDGMDFTLLPNSKRDQFLTRTGQNEAMLLLRNDKCVRPNGSSALRAKLENVSFASLKRKREPLLSMLNWVKTVAKNPTVKIIPSDDLKDMENLVGVHYSHAFQARKVLFFQKLQKEKKMHQFICEDCNGSAKPILQTSRCTESIRSSNRQSYSNSCSKSSTVYVDEKVQNHNNKANEPNNSVQTHRVPVFLPDYLANSVLKHVPVSSSFQAKVPPWTTKPTTSYDSDDLKWLGRRIWPPEHHEKKLPTPPDPIQRGGSEDSCECKNPGSVECVRFHVAEKRLQLKCELGSAFYAWRFHLMGEEVSLSWRADEEQRFKTAFRQNQQPHNQNFWKQLHLCFPGKGKGSLVSYYFNVFLLARRSYQNRVSPNNIDSEDEEIELDFLSCDFGYGAMRFRDPRSIICGQNLQCVDLGD